MPALNGVLPPKGRVEWASWPIVVHSVRTAVVAVVSLVIARSLRLPQAYWAPITSLVITQSSLGSAFAVSWQRFVGTVLGAVVGAILAAYLPPNLLVFGIGVFILGLLSPLALADRSAFRFGGITVAIVLLTPRTEPAWRIALHRFAEVSVGIGVAVIFAVLWPEREPTPSGKS